MPPKLGSPAYKGDLYELLCLLLVGTCIWSIGQQLGLFPLIAALVGQYDLINLVLLGCCMSVAFCVAALLKSKRLRHAIEARELAKLDAEQAARQDALTGLPNRRYFHELLAARLADQALSSRTALILIDLDRFKLINDIHGHAAGDLVLCEVARRIKAILPPSSVVARLGGDEFGAILTDVTAGDALQAIAQRIMPEVARPIFWTHCQLSVGATVGIAVPTPGSDTCSHLIHAADIAMYEGKKDGRGVCRMFREEMRETLLIRARTEQDLRTAIDCGQIEPFFQPLVALVDNRLIGFEVLARWHHPERGLLEARDFIGVAEDSGLIGDLCWAVLRRACLDAQHWPEHLQLAINIAPQQLHDRRLAERIDDILKETGFEPGRLEIEVTETAVMSNLDSARRAFRALRQLGVRIALDDFGTGYSSLYHLREMKFDKLKIDRSYVASLSNGNEPQGLVDAILVLGRSLGMDTTAEGIETVGNINWLVEKGCTFGQGFFFGRPMSNIDVERWVDEWSEARILPAPIVKAA